MKDSQYCQYVNYILSIWHESAHHGGKNCQIPKYGRGEAAPQAVQPPGLGVSGRKTARAGDSGQSSSPNQKRRKVGQPISPRILFAMRWAYGLNSLKRVAEAGQSVSRESSFLSPSM